MNVTLVTTQIYCASTELDGQRGAHGFNIGSLAVAGNPSNDKNKQKYQNEPVHFFQEIVKWSRALANLRIALANDQTTSVAS
jgi:hypothetical protein